MDRETTDKVLHYIEENLSSDECLSNAVLARAAGYSEFHFLRLFRTAVGLTPADYVRKRRISEVVRRSAGGGSFAEAAFALGFNSKENFTRAFRKEHGILPTEFRKADCSLRLYEPRFSDRAEPAPEVSIAHLGPFSVTAYPMGTDFPPRSWNLYNAEKRSARLSGGPDVDDYGVMFRNAAGKIEYFIGIRTDLALGDTSGTVRMDIQECVYAVFRTEPASRQSFVETIQRTWDWVYDRWMPQNGFRRGPGLEFECYRESSRTFCESIFVPLGADGRTEGGCAGKDLQ